MIPRSALNLIVWMAAMYITRNMSKTSEGYVSYTARYAAVCCLRQVGMSHYLL